MTSWIALFVIVPMAAAFVALLLKTWAPRAAPWLSVGSMVALLAMAVAAVARGETGAVFAGGWGPGASGNGWVPGIALVMDPLARLFLLLVATISTVVSVHGLGYVAPEEGRPLYHVLFCLLVAGMNGVVLSGDVFNQYVFLEVASIASYGLVGWKTGAEEVEASFKYLVVGAVASTAIMLGIILLYGATGRLNMADLSVAVSAGGVPSPVLLLAMTLYLAGFGIKAAVIPFHAWLPDAHPSAPAPISAMLSGLLIKTLGVYALLRMFVVVLGMDERVRAVLTILGSVSMWGGVLLAMVQDDLKRLLAYSSVSQIGYVFVALGLGTWLGTVAALFHLVNHAVFKSALFLASGSVERVAGTRRLSEMGGLFRRAPATSAGLLGASLSIAGVPPFNGFWSKLLILVALFSAGQVVVGALAAGAAVLTLATFVKVQRRALFGAPPPRLEGAREAPALLAVPVLVLAALCLVGGLLWPLGLDDIVGSAASVLVAPEGGRGGVPEYLRLVLGRAP